MLGKGYYFGQLITEINVFAYPRVGSHFLYYCLSGLFDCVTPPHEFLQHSEAVSRQDELNPDALYALSLREPGVPWQPVHFNPLANGVHGTPVESDCKTILLIRDPVVTAYSRYRVELSRWGGLTRLTNEWLRHQLLSYSQFYRIGFDVIGRQEEHGMVVRWEDLVAGPEALEQVVMFVGAAPKLKPSFVWQLTRFDNFVKPGERTFYRSGSNDASLWDPQWVAALTQIEDLSFADFGYASIPEYVSRAMAVSV